MSRQPKAYFHSVRDTEGPCCDKPDPSAGQCGDFWGDYQAWTLEIHCLNCGKDTTILVEYPWWPSTTVASERRAHATPVG